ncbi:hypothetical protein EC973_005905 [Apophysomyces ossiformis]|uniref:Uncharacterized protein n=1 Tax=Apophysomyces ossiformis TaxID=679940 RepID=A0A8H7BEM5_9FUNG|nr:hypothetical protein EC973_005905 [Apophysomyces ossiformis]
MDPPAYDSSSEKRLFRSPTVVAAATSGLLTTLIMPVFNIIISCVLIGVIIYTYIVANNKTEDFTLAGMRVPTLLSALSEYKWVKLQRQQGKLSLLEMYDGCSRGVGGIFRVIYGFRLDAVLAVALVFHLGLIAIGPAAQQILGTGVQIVCDQSHNRLDFNNITSTNDLSTFTHNSFGNGYDPRGNHGLLQDYIVRMAFAQASVNRTGAPNFSCGDRYINCTFPDIPLLTTKAVCQRGSLQTKIVDIHKRNVTTISSYFRLNTTNAIFKSPILPSTPQTLYAASMFNRTVFDLKNYSRPFSEIEKNLTEVRQHVGPQTFVFLSNNGTMHDAFNLTDLQVDECTLQTSLNLTTFVYRDDAMRILSSTSKPYPIDYDLLSNTSYWSENFKAPKTMHIAYGYQIELMNALVGDGYDAFHALVQKWMTYSDKGLNSTLDDLFSSLFFNTDLSVVLALPLDGFAGPFSFGANRRGSRCYYTPSIYHFEPSQFYPLALCLILPIAWWAVLWIMSMYFTNGVSRGHSQTALLVTGLSPSVKNHFKGYSHADQVELLKKANEIDVKFGETPSGSSRVGHVAFGQPGEVRSLPTRRRMSV